MKLGEAINAADRMAGIAWRTAGAPDAFQWRDALCRNVRPLAEFVAANPEASAEALYVYASRSQMAYPAWGSLPPAQRIAIDIFQATFARLYREVCAAAAAVPEVRPGLRVVPSSPRPAPHLVVASPELKRSPLVTGHVKAVEIDPPTIPQPLYAQAPVAKGGQPKAPENEILKLEQAWNGDTGRPAKRQPRNDGDRA